MIWLTWRQFRAQAVTAGAALAAFAILLASTGPHLASLSAGLAGCHGGCGQQAVSFLNQLSASRTDEIVYLLGSVLIFVTPAIIGTFWGAPLIARELETGTGRLAWTQSITRTRWLVVKLALTGLAAVAVTEALSLMHAWWAAPIGQAVGYGGSIGMFQGRLSLTVFATHGIAPLGYAAFAFALGVTAGAVLRRSLPAMAVTLVIFAAVQAIVPLWVRPNLLPPEHTTTTVGNASIMESRDGSTGPVSLAATANSVPGQPGAWVVGSRAVSAAGRPASTAPAACAPRPAGHSAASAAAPSGPQSMEQCLTSHGIRISISYLPASRYWPLQWAETAGYLALALALAGCCLWRFGRRLN